MGNKSSSSLSTEETAATDGNSTITRAIARGRVYLVIRYPRSLEDAEENFFNTSNYRDIMRDLQQKLPDFEVTMDVGKVERFCEHITFFNSSDPNKEVTRPRVLVEVLYTGIFGGINKDMVKKVVQEKVDPHSQCYIDIRCEMGRYHTTSHLETLLRV